MLKRILCTLLAATTLCGGMASCTRTTPPLEKNEGKTTVQPVNPVAPPDDSLAGKYGAMIESLNGDYAHYRFEEVTETPLLDISFDQSEDLGTQPNEGSAGGMATLSDPTGAKLIAGRFDRRKALELTKPNTYVAAPDLGELEALTISMCANSSVPTSVKMARSSS